MKIFRNSTNQMMNRMKWLKKAMSMLMMVFLIFSLLPMMAFPASAGVPAGAVAKGDSTYWGLESVNGGEDLTWTLYLDGDAAFLVIDGDGPMRDGIIDCDENVQSVIIGSGVTGIGAEAFSGEDFRYVESVEFEEPCQLAVIGASAFKDCASLDFDIPTSVTEIGADAFSGSGLTKAYIPAGMDATAIKEAYGKCGSLEKYIIAENNQDFISDDGVLISADKKTLVSYPVSKESKSYTLPDSVEKVDKDAFAGVKNLESITKQKSNAGKGVVLPEILGSIKSRLEIANTVQKLEKGALSEAGSYQEVFIPDSVKYIDFDVFKKYTSGDVGGAAGEDPLGEDPPAGTAIHTEYGDSYVRWALDEMQKESHIDLSDLDPRNAERVSAVIFDNCVSDLAINPPDHLYQYLPYEFTLKTRIPDNHGVVFVITDESGHPVDPKLVLPKGIFFEPGMQTSDEDGLGIPDYAKSIPVKGTFNRTGMLPGTFYGAPENYTDQNVVIYVVLWIDGYEKFPSAPFKVSLSFEPVPDQEKLEKTNGGLNKYAFVTDYGVADTITGESKGRIGDFNALSRSYVIRVASKSQIKDQSMEIDLNFNYAMQKFVGLWLDGQLLDESEYDLSEGSTVVTIMAQTIQELDKGDHTVAAGFTMADSLDSSSTFDAANATAQAFSACYGDWNDVLLQQTGYDFVAQNFTIIVDAQTPLGNEPNESVRSDAGNNSDGYSGDTSGADRDVNAGSDANANANNSANATTGNANPGADANANANADADNGLNTGSDANAGNDVNAGTEANAGTDAAAAAADSDAANPGEGANPAGSAAPGAGTTSANAANQGDNAYSGTASTAQDIQGSISGLPVNPDGMLYFDLEETVAPMELRINIPLNEFRDLYFDGELLVKDVDYTVREGSTILTFTAAWLARHEAGDHMLRAIFNNEAVEVAFLLNKVSAEATAVRASTVVASPAAASPTAASPGETPAATHSAQSAASVPGGRNPIFFVVAGMAALALAGATVLPIAKKRAHAGSAGV